MAKVGRNDPCPCNSGKKFKKCHGAMTTPTVRRAPGPTQADFDAMLRRAQAQQVQRVRQQGHGKPIISAEMNGTRFVAIGNQLAYGKWKTFPDFLINHVRNRLGIAWGQAEQAKPEAERHPFLHWWEVFGRQRQQHTTVPDGINSMPMTGAAAAIVGLAYDLYTIEHHINDPQARASFEALLARLRLADQFHGARHEARVAGMLLRAGFTLQWEDEQLRQANGHAEFVATFPETGRAFWVECKMRQPDRPDAPVRFTHLVSEALRKGTDLERLVFVELAIANGTMDPEKGGWPGNAINQLRKLEAQPTASELPPALIIVSNFPEHWQLDRPLEGAGVLMEGFKTGRYRMGQIEELLAAIEARERDREIEFLWRSLQEHSHVPSTFDGSLPGIDPDRRFILGEPYALPNGEEAILEEATVVEAWRQAACFLRLPDGRRVMQNFDLTEAELEAWKHHPDTFFGELRPYHRPAKGPMDLYDFFLASYSTTSREKLLEFMAHHRDAAALQELPQPELAKRYAYALTVSVAGRAPPPVAPAWHRLLRPPKKPG